MTDIVERLRAWADADPNAMLEGAEPDISAAADEIDRLRTALAADATIDAIEAGLLKVCQDLAQASEWPGYEVNSALMAIKSLRTCLANVWTAAKEQCASVCDDALGDAHPSDLAAKIRALSLDASAQSPAREGST